MERRWNWGAFLLAPLWPFWHGLPVVGVAALVCTFVTAYGAPVVPLWLIGARHGLAIPPESVVAALLLLGIAGFLGARGNALALQRRPGESEAVYRAGERRWAIAGIIVVVVVMPLVTVGIAWLFAALFAAALNSG